MTLGISLLVITYLTQYYELSGSLALHVYHCDPIKRSFDHIERFMLNVFRLTNFTHPFSSENLAGGMGRDVVVWVDVNCNFFIAVLE